MHAATLAIPGFELPFSGLAAWCRVRWLTVTGENPSDEARRWVLIRDLCQRALEREPAQREQFLDQACGSDTAMLEQARTLLRAQSATAPEPLHAGQRISHYRIEGRIGEGGMGTVYRAIDLNLGRLAALKVLSHGSFSGSNQQRFVREAKAASALNHPNIVTIYEFGSDAGISFLAMELVEGRTLGKILAGRGEPGSAVPLETLLGYARQIASALAKARAAGITHRDLKPGNVMITPEGAVKVLDFGLAKQESEAPSAEDVTMTAPTRPGAILGTPAYMSPEQAKGERITYRSDIFSFGIILYEMVCGSRPFRGPDPVSTLSQIILQNPVPVLKANPSAPPEAAALIDACLQKDPARRMASMSEAVASLGGTLTLAPLSAPASRARSRRWIAGTAGVAALASAGFSARIAYLKWAAGESVLSRFRGDSYALFEKASALLTKKYRKQYLDEAIGLLERAIEANPRHAASYGALAEAYVARNQAQFDEEWSKRALEAARKSVELNPDLAAAHVALGMALTFRQESGAEPEAALRRAIGMAPNNSLAHHWLGRVLARKGQLAEAESELATAVRLAPRGWESHAELGSFHFRRQKFAEAAGIWKVAAENSPDNPLIHRNLAAAFHMMGRLDESADSLQRALEIEPAAAVYNNLGTLRFFQGKYGESVAALEKAVEMNPSRYLYWGNLGDAYRWTPGQRAKAGAAYEKAIQLGGPGANRDNAIRGRLALYAAKKGDPGSAVAAIDTLRGSSWDGSMHYRAAVVLELAGRRKQALDELEAALAKGYAANEIANDPELASLRSDARYHRLAKPDTIQPAAR